MHAQPRSLWLTRANALTALRLLLAPLLVLSICADAPVAATLVFCLAVATDFADGYVARRFGEATSLGRLIDHSVDATFVTVGTAALAGQGTLPAALPAAIAISFLQYALGSNPRAGQGPRPSRLGKWNGIAYYVIVAVPIVRDSVGLGWPGPSLVTLAGWLLVVTSVVSIANRWFGSRESSSS